MRKQAAITLRAMQALVRVQARVRARHVRMALENQLAQQKQQEHVAQEARVREIEVISLSPVVPVRGGVSPIYLTLNPNSSDQPVYILLMQDFVKCHKTMKHLANLRLLLTRLCQEFQKNLGSKSRPSGRTWDSLIYDAFLVLL